MNNKLVTISFKLEDLESFMKMKDDPRLMYESTNELLKKALNNYNKSRLPESEKSEMNESALMVSIIYSARNLFRKIIPLEDSKSLKTLSLEDEFILKTLFGDMGECANNHQM